MQDDPASTDDRASDIGLHLKVYRISLAVNVKLAGDGFCGRCYFE
jgi:hypothetical protein